MAGHAIQTVHFEVNTDYQLSSDHSRGSWIVVSIVDC